MNKPSYQTLKSLSFCSNEVILNAENEAIKNTENLSSLEASNLSCETEKIKKVVILLHGYGSNAEDIISIAPSFKNLQNTLFIAPNAPYKIEGSVGKQWFSLLSTENPSGGFDVEISNFNEVKIASNLIMKFIAEVQELHQLDSKDISLFGFSQGGILALYTALHNDIQLGSVISHSGIYYGDGEDEKFNPNQKILMVHGEDDEVLPIEKFNRTLEYFKQNNIPFESHIEPDLTHSINATTIEICEQFLLNNK
jgi:phospholipase/carboxylesterase